MPIKNNIDHSEFFDEFTEWQVELTEKTKYIEQRFHEEAKKEPTFGKALDWLDRTSPDMPSSFIPSTQQAQSNLIREIIANAKNEIWADMRKSGTDK